MSEDIQCVRIAHFTGSAAGTAVNGGNAAKNAGWQSIQPSPEKKTTTSHGHIFLRHPSRNSQSLRPFKTHI